MAWIVHHPWIQESEPVAQGEVQVEGCGPRLAFHHARYTAISFEDFPSVDVNTWGQLSGSLPLCCVTKWPSPLRFKSAEPCPRLGQPLVVHLRPAMAVAHKRFSVRGALGTLRQLLLLLQDGKAVP